MGVDDVDDVAVGDVSRLGAFEGAAVLVEQETQLDEQRRRFKLWRDYVDCKHRLEFATEEYR